MRVYKKLLDLVERKMTKYGKTEKKYEMKMKNGSIETTYLFIECIILKLQ